MTDATATGQTQSGLYGEHPPKPVLTLRVGISGHRPKERTFPADALKYVPIRLAEVFGAIERALEDLKSVDKDFYAQDAGRKVIHKVRLVSGLAEGADQMAVTARPTGWVLDAILPFPTNLYLADFKHSAMATKHDVTDDFRTALAAATTVVELPRDPRMPDEEPKDDDAKGAYWAIRSQAYARLGHFLLGQIDVLVAVWDGKHEEGAGGTAEVVRGALAAGIPVVWISTMGNGPPRLVNAVDVDDRVDAPQLNDLSGVLKSKIATIVSVPEAVQAGAGNDDHHDARHGHRHHDIKRRLELLFKETWPPRTRAVIYDMFKKWIDKKALRWKIDPDTPEKYSTSWDSFLDDSPVPGPTEANAAGERYQFTKRVRDILLPRYAWVDAIAIEQSHRYRSAYMACYLLAILLAAIALLGVFTHDLFPESDHQGMLAYKAVLVAFEFALILLIVYIVRRGQKQRWLERWMEYRALAEMLRSARFLALLGEHGYVQRSHDLEPASSAWFLWYMRATARELGLPYAELNSAYQTTVLHAVEIHVIDDQLAYNRPTSKSLARMHHRLHTIGNVCFFLAAAVLFAFLAGYAAYLLGGWYSDKDAHWRHTLEHALVAVKSSVTFLAAFLPAIGAALYGIRETGDFEGFSERAERTADKLEQLKFVVGQARRRLTLDSTTAVLLATAQVLSEDLGAWQSVYGRKQLNLPA